MGANWYELNLNDDEQSDFEISVGVLETIKEHRSLIDRIYVYRRISKEVIRSIMLGLWKVDEDVVFREIRSNICVVTFEDEVDRDRVKDGGGCLIITHSYSSILKAPSNHI